MSQALKYNVINFGQDVSAILCKVWYTLNDPYLHYTLSIICYTGL